MSVAREKLDTLHAKTRTQVEVHDYSKRVYLRTAAHGLALESRGWIVIDHENQGVSYILRQDGRRVEPTTAIEQSQGDIDRLVNLLWRQPARAISRVKLDDIARGIANLNLCRSGLYRRRYGTSTLLPRQALCTTQNNCATLRSSVLDQKTQHTQQCSDQRCRFFARKQHERTTSSAFSATLVYCTTSIRNIQKTLHSGLFHSRIRIGIYVDTQNINTRGHDPTSIVVGQPFDGIGACHRRALNAQRAH